MDSTDDKEEFKKKLESLKPKKKIDFAEGLLDNAKSYEGKQMAIRIIAERELKRTVLLFKGMIAQSKEDAIRIEREKEVAKREAEAREAAEKKRKEEEAKKAKKSIFAIFGKKK
ncbi:hypothetical protein UFOVP257_184 [uncultured Caudovirales phage]|uniref:Uncharacterized protein n=1 Tax=uncultured Caudovirales phage TaxID=2100421 RepID=A0A6J5LGT2_9CAUD|nr:hypothetical protein UFOVP257_184 [uncultured Caudovirales phage]